MTQLDMFNETSKNGKREIEVKPELTDYQRRTIEIDFADDYIIKKGFGELIEGKWFYKRDEYKLLHYIARHGLGLKNSIPGYELCAIMFNNKNTEKLRAMINDLRNDKHNDLIIGSSQKGYFIAQGHEMFEAVKYIFGKSVNEMITAINMYPPLAERFIKIASRTYQDNERVFDSQLTAQFDELCDEIIIRYADTFRGEAYREWKQKT